MEVVCWRILAPPIPLKGVFSSNLLQFMFMAIFPLESLSHRED